MILPLVGLVQLCSNALGEDLRVYFCQAKSECLQIDSKLVLGIDVVAGHSGIDRAYLKPPLSNFFCKTFKNWKKIAPATQNSLAIPFFNGIRKL